MESNNKSETAGKVLRCKAAISRIPGEPLVIEDIEVDPPKAWEIRIKILCTSLCHTDITFWKMKAGPAAVFPRIFGHEAVGVVESVGENVEEFTVGDTVLPVFLPNCKECSDCKSQKSNICSIFENKFSPEMPRDGTSRFKDMNGEILHHFLWVSSFSEYTVVDVTHAVKITPEIPVDKACLLGCGVSTGIGAAWKVAEVEEGSTVSNGVMNSVTTMQGINEKILSLDYKDFKAEIKTADAQKSYKDGVTVLVTGCLTGKDNLRRKFAQSFFLAPQDNGYFVLNDVFRYVEDGEPLDNHAVNGVNDVTTVPIISEREPSHVSDPPATDPETSPVEEDGNVVEKSYDPSEHEIQLAIEKEAVQPPSHSNGDDVSIAVESSSSAQDDTPKQSYASIVRVIKGSPVPTNTNTMKVVPKKSENQSLGSVPPTSIPEASAPSSVGTPESSNTQEDVEGHSIYIRNLPFSMTAEQLEVEFKKFGPIKPGGIQVRNNKQQGYCFGFVEFQSLSSMNRAIEDSPITIGGRKAEVEIKRTTARVGSSGRGRFSSGRGFYRNESFKSRGSYGGGRGYGRSDYGNRGDFSGRGSDFAGRGRGPAGRGEGYQQGRGRGGRSSGPKQNVSS